MNFTFGIGLQPLDVYPTSPPAWLMQSGGWYDGGAWNDSGIWID